MFVTRGGEEGDGGFASVVKDDRGGGGVPGFFIYRRGEIIM